jgi:hypothetical protein
LTSEKNAIGEISLEKSLDKPRIDDNIAIDVKFSITGAFREDFNEKNWEKSYKNHDNSFKLRYSIKIHTGGLRKKEIGKPLDTYKKVALFWTRNPKLTQMGERKVWVQISKNFEPFIPKNQIEAQQMLLDFDEKIQFNASDLGVGKHKIGAEVHVAWFKHDYIEPFDETVHSKELEVEVIK